MHRTGRIKNFQPRLAVGLHQFPTVRALAHDSHVGTVCTSTGNDSACPLPATGSAAQGLIRKPGWLAR